ncbi:MAG: vWA domain-containing protein, partial [Pseudomonadales bacterium]
MDRLGVCLRTASDVGRGSAGRPCGHRCVGENGADRPAQPARLAVGMLLQMLPEDAHAGIWTFSDQVDELVKHGITDQLFKQIAEIQLARLPTGGQRSNLLEALDRASWDAVNPSGRSRHIVLLAHGALDISDDNAVNEVARQRLLEQRLPALRDAGFKIHTVAVSDAANVALLAEIAKSTGGTTGRVDTAVELRAFLLKVLDNVAMNSLLPHTPDAGFRVDGGIKELTILRLRAADDPTLTLSDPGGTLLDRTTPQSQIRWHKDVGYDLVSIRDPAPGTWRFQSSSDGDIRVVAVGDLSLQLVGVPGTLLPGGPKTFELYLLSDGRRLTDADFLEL